MSAYVYLQTAFLRICPEDFCLEILHAVRELCLEKSHEEYVFGKKCHCSKIGSFSPVWVQKLVCSLPRICSKDFFEIFRSVYSLCLGKSDSLQRYAKSSHYLGKGLFPPILAQKLLCSLPRIFPKDISDVLHTVISLYLKKTSHCSRMDRFSPIWSLKFIRFVLGICSKGLQGSRILESSTGQQNTRKK